MRAINHSKQRDAIVAYLKSTKSHPTAETVYQHVQAEFPRISLATVYRNLALLEELGEAQRVLSGDAKEHYDANVEAHPHFQCRTCGKVYDLEMDSLDFLKTLGNSCVNGKIDTVQVLFMGQCQSCLENENNY